MIILVNKKVLDLWVGVEVGSKSFLVKIFKVLALLSNNWRISIHLLTNMLFSYKILSVVSNDAMNIKGRIFLWDSVFISFRYIPRSEIVGLYGNSIFNFLRESPYYFQQWLLKCINNSYQQCTSVLFFPHLCQHSCLIFLMVAILTGVKPYLVVLIYISLMISDTEPLFSIC